MLRCWTSLPCSMKTGSECGWEAIFLSHNHNRGICRNCQIHIGIHIYGHMSYMHMISKRTFQNENISFKAKYEVSIVSFKLSFKLQTADDAQWPEGCHAEHSKSLLNYAILKLYLKPYSIIFIIINLCYSEIMWVWGVSYHKWESSRLTQTQTHSIAEKDQAW